MKKDEERRISLRFYLDRERDKKALEILDSLRSDSNLSYNEIILNMIVNAKSILQAKENEELVEDIAKAVACFLRPYLSDRNDNSIEWKEDNEQIKQTAPIQLDEGVLSFLSDFGID